MTTPRKSKNLAINIPPRNDHEMEERSRIARFLNKSAGRASLPTSVPMLRASEGGMILK